MEQSLKEKMKEMILESFVNSEEALTRATVTINRVRLNKAIDQGLIDESDKAYKLEMAEIMEETVKELWG